MSIQFKRGTTAKIKESTDTLAAGQPLFDLETHELYIADKDGSAIKNLKPITASNIQNGEGVSSLAQKYIDNSVDYSAKATGINAVAFGGKRYDKLSDSNRTATSAEGNQSFASGGSTHAMADYCTAMGKDSIAYQRGSFTAAMGGRSGMSEEEFNTYYWDDEAGSALHEGKGLDSEGHILDEYGKTYDISYSTAATFGDDVECKGYGDFGCGTGNRSWGSANFVTGTHNHVEGKHNIVGGENNSVTGDVGNSLVFGQGLKNPGRWNKIIFGQFNGPSENNILEIGDGTSDGQRHNLLALRYDGFFTTPLYTRSSMRSGLGEANDSMGNIKTVVGNYPAFSKNAIFKVGDGTSETDTRTVLQVQHNGITRVETCVTSGNLSIGRQNYIGNTNATSEDKSMKVYYTALIGSGLENKGRENQLICGQYNEYNSTALFQVGTGNSSTDRKSGFEVLWNGKARSTAKPADDNDYVRMLELNNAKTTLQSSIDTKANRSDLSTLQTTVTKIDKRVQTLESDTTPLSIYIGSASEGTISTSDALDLLRYKRPILLTFSYEYNNYNCVLSSYTIYQERVGSDRLSASGFFNVTTTSAYKQFYFRIDSLEEGTWHFFVEAS